MKKIFSVAALAILLSACSNNAKEEAIIKQQAIVAVKDSLRLDSFKKADALEKEKLAKLKDEEIQKDRIREEKRTLLLAERNDAAERRSSSSSSSNTVATPAKKKGWSQAAKGAAIGAGAGALGGILVDKNNARGAIIGGVVGAGTGYVIGRGQDRKSGRVQPKN
ncbi:YMGG-like glycine zipper-containing protein [Pedobacter gandavensis]|uniref:YMGG-like glycine zipper-containing protein n=1 Tax=Pedobacter gandavensis TaxID=2679963 RepID=UPI002478EB8B|nr:YMGG-like glycine zipper-containing protein [Pedobacter gandavensis]WGQ10106.1 YMGG-like glycine zipper-containing protein [Pedobacter gandavensis]